MCHILVYVPMFENVKDIGSLRKMRVAFELRYVGHVQQICSLFWIQLLELDLNLGH